MVRRGGGLQRQFLIKYKKRPRSLQNASNLSQTSTLQNHTREVKIRKTNTEQRSTTLC